jgi:hypothetical protein
MNTVNIPTRERRSSRLCQESTITADVREVLVYLAPVANTAELPALLTEVLPYSKNEKAAENFLRRK